MKLTSPEIEDGKLPEKYGYMGDNVNPPLKIEEIPDDSEALAVVFQDPDAQEMAGKTWLHWLTWNISPDKEKIEEDKSPGIEGMTDFREAGYNGPNPPDGQHKLVFKVYALSGKLELQKEASLDEFEQAIEDKILEEADLEAFFP